MVARRWQRVSQALAARQRQLGLSQQELVQRSGVSSATMRKLQSGRSDGFRAETLARVAAALEWPPDALLTILDGGAPPDGVAVGTTGRAREARLATLAAGLAPHELRAVERLVEELVKGPGHPWSEPVPS